MQQQDNTNCKLATSASDAALAAQYHTLPSRRRAIQIRSPMRSGTQYFGTTRPEKSLAIASLLESTCSAFYSTGGIMRINDAMTIVPRPGKQCWSQPRESFQQDALMMTLLVLSRRSSCRFSLGSSAFFLSHCRSQQDPFRNAHMSLGHWTNAEDNQ